jgi:hypothetical protein
MPSTGQILEGLASIANGWRALAIIWHVVVGVLLVLIGTRRISDRALGLALASMIASVSAMAWWSTNSFNGAVFAVLAVAMAWQAIGMPGRPACTVSRGALPIGLAAVMFGWAYPHFLENASCLTYAYAAPMGLIPCPSLAAIIGVSLMANLLDSPRWGLTTGVAGLTYGIIGVARLGVWIDVWLIAAASGAVAASLRMRRATTSAAALPAPPAPGSARA